MGAGCNTRDDDDDDERWLALDDEMVRVTRLLRPMSAYAEDDALIAHILERVTELQGGGSGQAQGF